MKNELRIQGYKCFRDISLTLNNISILVGANGAGKSSIIQSLLLLNGAHKAQKKETISLPTHNIMGVDLGRVDDLFYDDKSFELQKDLTSDILLSLDNFRINIPFQKNEGNSPDIIIEFKVQSELDFPLKDIHYLDAERLGPRYICEYKGLNKDSCGIHGENTAYVWFTHESDRIDNKKWLSPSTDGKFQMQLGAWIKYIFDGASLSVRRLYDRALQIQVANRKEGTSVLHIGFGLSYALPILVEGLILKDGDTLIIENPEAHLQPKAQTRLGFFLAIIASSGVKLLIETHSEHIIKGIIKATSTASVDINEDDISIYYINSDIDDVVSAVSINDARNNKYPNGFFDIDAEILNEKIKEREIYMKSE